MMHFIMVLTVLCVFVGRLAVLLAVTFIPGIKARRETLKVINSMTKDELMQIKPPPPVTHGVRVYSGLL